MKRFLAFLLAIAFAGQAWADEVNYDISNGSLYYKIISSTEVAVTFPNRSTGGYDGYNKPSGAIVIPETVVHPETGVSYSVTSITAGAFYYCDITSISLPNCITNVGMWAFGDRNKLQFNEEEDAKYLGNAENPHLCLMRVKSENITTFEINNNCKCISGSAFSGSGLESITIPNSVAGISEYAFECCVNLRSINFGNDIKKIGDYSFHSCEKLTSITIPNSVTNIGDGAFEYCSNLYYVTLGSGIETIGTDAFKDCPIETLTYNSNIAGSKLDGLTTLKTVNIGDAVTTISNGAFRYSTGLTAINVSADNDNFCSIDGVVFSKDKKTLIRYPAGKSGSYTIPDGVTAIGKYAFCGCKSLSSVTIPNSVTSIGDFAFYQCSGLTSVTIPNSVTSIGSRAFDNCPIETLTYNTNNIGQAFGWNSTLKTINIGNDVTSIERWTFGGCQGLISISIPQNVTSIGEGAFYNCSNLSSISIPNSVESIGSMAFMDCSSLTAVSIPNSVTSIDSRAFYGCSGLTTISLSNSITNISEQTFFGCRSLTTITIPENVTSIGLRAFYNCSGLTSIIIPNSVTSIGEGAFYNCSSLTSITIPAGVTELNYQVIDGCSGLTSICYEGSSEPIFFVFNEIDYTIPVCVPADYSSNSWCGHFTNLIKGHNKVTDVAVAATCTETGLTEGSHCSYCGKIITVQEIIPASHTYNTTITTPTCTAVGYTTHSCFVCESTYNSDTVAATGHTADSVAFENVVAATCTVAGTKDSVVYCSVCQDELSRETKEIPAKGHTVVIDEAVEPTCTKTGLGEGKHCSVCNEYDWTQELIPPLGHDFGKYVYNNDATLEADGTETAVCSRCGEKDTHVAEGTKLNATAVSDAASTLNIYANHNIIVVENATDEIRVYDAMGKLICRDVACRVRTEIRITTPGVYIVKTGNAVKRVMVN